MPSTPMVFYFDASVESLYQIQAEVIERISQYHQLSEGSEQLLHDVH